MGNNISGNYVNVRERFKIGFWKVYSGCSKLTEQEVSLWEFNYELFKKKVAKKKQERDRYLKSVLDSLLLMRKLIHPHILKIYEINNSTSNISFSSEVIEDPLLYENDFSEDESVYIAMQLAETMDFLHNKAKYCHLGLSMESVFFNSSLCIKICQFQFASPIAEDRQVTNPNESMEYDILLQDISYVAPEVVKKLQLTSSLDVFSFGCIFATLLLKQRLIKSTTYDGYSSEVRKIQSAIPTNCSSESQNLLKSCLELNPFDRPSAAQILNSKVFCSLSARVLKYMDLSITKDLSDKICFYKKLDGFIDNFSFRLRRYKILPLLIDEMESNSDLCECLIPLSIKNSKDFDKEDFISEVLNTVIKFLKEDETSKITIAFFSVFNIVVSKCSSEYQSLIVFPIFVKALQSGEKSIQESALQALPLLVEQLDQATIQSALIPQILEFIELHKDQDTVVTALSSLKTMSVRVDPLWFTENVIPFLTFLWKNGNKEDIVEPLAKILYDIRTHTENSLNYIVPFSSMLLSYKNSSKDTQIKLSHIILDCIKIAIEERGLENQVKSQATPKKRKSKEHKNTSSKSSKVSHSSSKVKVESDSSFENHKNDTFGTNDDAKSITSTKRASEDRTASILESIGQATESVPYMFNLEPSIASLEKSSTSIFDKFKPYDT